MKLISLALLWTERGSILTQHWLALERSSGASHGNLGPLETFLGWFLNTVAGMDGPEIAGELYQVFKQWLAQRVLQGFTPAEGGEAVVPRTPDEIAAVTTEALAELAESAKTAPYPLPLLPAKHEPFPAASGGKVSLTRHTMSFH